MPGTGGERSGASSLERIHLAGSSPEVRALSLLVSDAPPASDPVAPIPPSPQRRDRLVTPRFMVVTAATFAYFCSLGSMLPTLPRYVRDELGGGGTEVGLVVGAFAVSAALIRPWAGRLGDVRGRRVLVSGGSAVLALSVLGYAAVDSLVPLIALRLVSGIGEAARFVGAATAVQDLAPDDRRGEAASYFSVALYGGLALGPAAGERILSTWGFDAVWYAAAAAGLVAAVLGLFTPSGPTSTGVRPDRLLHGAALGPGLVLLLGLIPFTGFAAFLALYGEQVGVDDVGPVFALYAGTVLVIRIFGARLPDLLGWRRASTLALLSVGTGAAVLAAWPAAGAVWLAAVAMAVGMSLLFPALFIAAMAGVPDHERSQAVGTFSLFFDLSQGIGAPVLGIVVALSSERGAFAASVLVAAGGFLAQRSLAARRAGMAASPAT
jgi:MFS family permease